VVEWDVQVDIFRFAESSAFARDTFPMYMHVTNSEKTVLDDTFLQDLTGRTLNVL
jgi:hypothetical protein